MENINYKNVRSLKKVKDVIAEADEALKDRTRTTPKFVAELSGLAAAAIAGEVIATAFASVLAAPIVIIGGTIVGFKTAEKQKRINEEKARLYNLALQERQAIIDELKEQQVASKERINYLESINVLLQESIIKLREDLENARSIQV